MKPKKRAISKYQIKCPICNNKKKKIIIWDSFIRSGNKSGRATNGGWISKPIFTPSKEKIYKCLNCDVGFLKNLRNNLEINNKLFRKIFDGSNSVKKYKSFNQPRELRKFKKIEKLVNFKNKTVFESNCGGGVILDKIKKKAKKTVGLDHEGYRKYLESKGHLFFSNLIQVKKSNLKFDIILSLGEIEHKFNPSLFLKKLKTILSEKGIIIFRIPNYNNIYKFFIERNFLKYDYRISHNFYFSEKSLDFFFKSNDMDIIKKTGLHEYSFNHLIDFIKKQKRVSDKKRQNLVNENLNKLIIQNLENNMVSTSLLYIVKKK